MTELAKIRSSLERTKKTLGKISVSAEDGKDLPKGVTYSPASRAFTVANLAEVTLPISVMVTITRQGNVVSTKKLIVSP